MCVKQYFYFFSFLVKFIGCLIQPVFDIMTTIISTFAHLQIGAPMPILWTWTLCCKRAFLKLNLCPQTSHSNSSCTMPFGAFSAGPADRVVDTRPCGSVLVSFEGTVGKGLSNFSYGHYLYSTTTGGHGGTPPPGQHPLSRKITPPPLEWT